MRPAVVKKERNYWVWVTHPGHYLEEDGKLRSTWTIVKVIGMNQSSSECSL
jgi:hypothetical protein